MRAGKAGFTLLEMVVALTILAIIVGSVAVTFRVAAGSMERGEEAARDSARLRAGIGVVMRAIRSADPAGIPMDNGASAPYFSGTRDRVRLLSAAPVSSVFGRGFRLLSFFGSDEPGAAGLALSEASAFRVEGAQQWEGTESPRVIIRGAGDVSFSYSPGPTEEGTWDWLESWEAGEKGGLPAAVRVEFTTPSAGGPLKTSFVVPVPAGGGG